MGILGLVDCSQNLCMIMVLEGAMELVQFARHYGRPLNTISMVGNYAPSKKTGRGAQIIFPLGHTQVDYDSKQAFNLQ